MDWLPPIEVSRISDGGKVRPHKELFLIQSDYSVRYGSFLFESSYRKPPTSPYQSSIFEPHTSPFIH